MSAEDDRRFMDLALALSARGLGNVWPNPAVGCVIVAGGRIVGHGWTQPGGRPHAEVVALAEAGAAARGATAYVTLEPCAHTGKTGPCAVALAQAGVARVVSALQDPDPRVAGRGHAILRDAGVAVEVGQQGADAARHLQRGFLMRVTAGRPMLTLKLATSLDGRIATASGESRWITGPEARAMVHGQRARHDAVLIGGGTARADNPMLTVRGLGEVRQPVRIVATRGLDLDPGAALGQSAREVPLWLVHGPSAPESARARWSATGARLFEVPQTAGGLDPAALLARLGAEGLTRVYCEGGGTLAASLLAAGLVDDLVLFQAGLSLGADARAAIGALNLDRLADAPRFRLIDSRPVGGDLYSLWTRP